jgi:hypothetical protein
MKLQSILQELAAEVNKVSYQGSNNVVAKVSLPKKAVDALSDELYAKERTGAIKNIDIKSIHFNEGIVEIDTL